LASKNKIANIIAQLITPSQRPKAITAGGCHRFMTFES
jgi:hypothetical protein